MPGRPIGPLLMTLAEAADAAVELFPASSAGELCGRRWDWVAAIDEPG